MGGVLRGVCSAKGVSETGHALDSFCCSVWPPSCFRLDAWRCGKVKRGTSIGRLPGSLAVIICARSDAIIVSMRWLSLESGRRGLAVLVAGERATEYATTHREENVSRVARVVALWWMGQAQAQARGQAAEETCHL
jgi:hypothetical protein